MKKKLYDIAPLFISSMLSAAASQMVFKTFGAELSFGFCLLWAVIATFFVYAILINKKVALGFVAAVIVAGVILYFRLSEESREIIIDFFDKLMAFIREGQELPSEYMLPFGIFIVAALSFILVLPAVIFPFFPALLAISITLILAQWGSYNTEKLTEAAIMLGALIIFFAHSMHYHTDQRTQNVRNISVAWLAPLIAIIVAIIIGVAQSNPLNERWEWLKLRANIVGDYFSELSGATSPRSIFDLSKTGYQPLGGRLGGPVSLDKSEVMEVLTKHPILLRGNIKNTYTGESWVDDSVSYRSRMTPRYEDQQNKVFNLDMPPDDLKNDYYFQQTDVFISPSIDASSTVFAPIRVIDVRPSKVLTMLISFNSEGEVFSSRNIDAGIAYIVKSEYINYKDLGFGQYVADVQSSLSAAELEYPEDIVSNYLTPFAASTPNIDRLAAELTSGIGSDYEKAVAIKKYLENGFTYKLTPAIPPPDIDFVEYFLETKEGYCTYFASAMAVLSRSAGLPSRYVEGFKTKPGSSDKIQSITGENAHAWSEIYIRGIGWLPFEPETRASGAPVTDILPEIIPEDIEEEPSPEPEMPLDLPERAPFDFTPIIIVLAILSVLALACMALLALAKIRIRLSYLKKTLGDTNKIILFYYTEIMVLMVYLKYEKPIGTTLNEYAQGVDSRINLNGVSFSNAVNIVTEILYAQKSVSDNDMAYVYDYHKALLSYIKSDLGVLRYFLIMTAMMFNNSLRRSVLPF